MLRAISLESVLRLSWAEVSPSADSWAYKINVNNNTQLYIRGILPATFQLDQESRLSRNYFVHVRVVCKWPALPYLCASTADLARTRRHISCGRRCLHLLLSFRRLVLSARGAGRQASTACTHLRHAARSQCHFHYTSLQSRRRPCPY